jgi:hypothetical protein
MRLRHAVGLGCCLLLVGAGRSVAQTAMQPPPAAVPPAAAAPPPAPGAATPSTAAGAAARAKGPLTQLVECLCPTPEKLEAKRQKFCNCALGRLVNSMLKPVTTFSGGLIPDLCPPNKPTTADLTKDPTSAEGAAAHIQKLEAEAAARRAAVRYLGTVDCHWYPEAEAALINALRTDPNECVRLEAALALSRGCCCTKGIIEALTICVNGSSKDKHPSETSPRVKAIAYVALQRCLACPAPGREEAPEPPEQAPTPSEKAPTPREKVPEPKEADTNQVALRRLPMHYRRLDAVPYATVLAEARKALTEMEQAQLAAGTPPSVPPATILPAGERDLMSILRFSLVDPPPTAPTATTTEPPMAPARPAWR